MIELYLWFMLFECLEKADINFWKFLPANNLSDSFYLQIELFIYQFNLIAYND